MLCSLFYWFQKDERQVDTNNRSKFNLLATPVLQAGADGKLLEFPQELLRQRKVVQWLLLLKSERFSVIPPLWETCSRPRWESGRVSTA